MKLSEIKKILHQIDKVDFQLENGALVPEHFHITEVGIITKKFIDCGGIIRNEEIVNFQLWNANDYNHRLKPIKLLNIIKLSENKLDLKDLEIEVEYQSNTIGKYSLDFKNDAFILIPKHTNCLAKDQCGIPVEKDTIETQTTCCTPEGSCC